MLNAKFLNREEGGVMQLKDTRVLEQKNLPQFLFHFAKFSELMSSPILRPTEAPSPEAEASTALIAGNNGSEPNPRGLLSSGAVLHQKTNAMN